MPENVRRQTVLRKRKEKADFSRLIKNFVKFIKQKIVWSQS